MMPRAPMPETTPPGAHRPRVSAVALASIRGMLHFADAEVLDHETAPTLRLPASVSNLLGGKVPVVHEFVRALRWLGARLRSAPPRLENAQVEAKPEVEFADGAAEGLNRRTVTVDGVCIDVVSGLSEFLGFAWDPGLFVERLQLIRAQGFCQAELYPFLATSHVWTEVVSHTRLLICADYAFTRLALSEGSHLL